LLLNVPRFLRFPVFGFFFLEYSRYLPDFSFLIMIIPPYGQAYARRATEYSQRARTSRALNCKQPPRLQSQDREPEGTLQGLPQPIRKAKREKRCQNCEVGRKM